MSSDSNLEEGSQLILVVALIVGIGIALLRKGRLQRLADLPFRLGWLALLSIAAQVYVIYSPASRLELDRPIHAAIMMGSYLALGVVVWVNRRIVGMPIIGLGLLLNLAVMASNGGFMPISREAILAAGTHPANELLVDGSRLDRSKDVLLPADQTRLWILSDVIVASKMPLARVYSLGDLIVAVGAFLLLQAAMVPGRETRSIEREARTG